MSDTQRFDAIVVGAGISGLTTALLLQRAGKRVLLLEAATRVGGAIRSERRDGWLIEAGPNSTLETTPLLTELIRDVGAEQGKLYANDSSKNRYILRDGQLRALPMSPPAFVRSTLFSGKAKLRLFREPFIPPSAPDAEESVADFVRRRLGNEFLDYAINPFVAGVYAGDPEQLDVRAAFPKLHALEQTYGSLIKGTIRGARERKRRGEESKQSARMFSFRDGMQTLTDAISACLAHVRTGVHIDRIEADAASGAAPYVLHYTINGASGCGTADVLVLAVPADAAARLSSPLLPALSPLLEAIPYPPVAEVLTGFAPAPGMHTLDGFGFLIPRVERRRILGTIFSSSIFSDRAPDGHALLTTFVGGMRQPDEALKSHDDILATALAEQQALLGTPAQPAFAHVTSWKRAIPQYVRGHLGTMRAVDEAEAARPGLFFCANYRGGISVGDCVKSAHAIADAALAQLGRA